MQNDLFAASKDANKDSPSTITKGLGGSELAALLGLNPGMSALELWRVKTNRPVTRQRSEAMRRGVVLEPVVKKLFEQHTQTTLKTGQRLRHPRWQEGVVMKALTDGTLPDGRIFEAKTTHEQSPRHQQFMAGHIPLSYALQLQHYAAVCGADGVIACLSGPNKPLPWHAHPWILTIIEWHRIPALCAMLEDIVGQWFKSYVQADRPPPAQDPMAERVCGLLDGEQWTQPSRHISGQELDAQILEDKGPQLTLFG